MGTSKPRKTFISCQIGWVNALIYALISSSLLLICEFTFPFSASTKPDWWVNSHKAENNTCNETTWKACNDTSLMGMCFCHDSVIYMANIHVSGETWAHPLTILKCLLENINEDGPPGIIYDIGCFLDKYMHLLSNIVKWVIWILTAGADRLCFVGCQ